MKTNEDALAIELLINEVQQANKDLETVLHKYVNKNYSDESKQRKNSFVKAILSIVFPNKENLSAKEFVANETLANISDKKTCLEVTSQICFKEATMQEALTWEEKFKNSYSEDDPNDVDAYRNLLKS